MNAAKRSQLAEDIEKLRAMTRRQRLRFIASYYWLWIAGILCAVSLTVYLAVHLAAGAPEYRLYAVFANTRADADSGSALWEDFTAYAGYDPHEKRVQFDDESYFDYTRNQAKGNTYYNAFVTLADTGTLDLITMAPEQLAALGQSGRLLDLRLQGGLCERYRDRLIWYHSEQGEDIPVGIDVSDSLLATRYALYSEGCALGIAAQSTRVDSVERFLSFILEEG